MPLVRDRSLNGLALSFRPRAFEFLARLVERGVHVLIVETRRSAEAHAEDVASGHSWVAHSKHEDGLAMDVCPFFVWMLHGPDKLQWDADDPVWEVVAQTAEALGLKSGYRWAQRDCGHIELP